MKNPVILLIAMIMTGCGVYHPQSTDTPLITQKHDLRLDAGISIIPSANATISYGLTNKIAMQAFGTVGSDERYYFQFAPGIYKQFKNQTVGEIYAGAGYGHGKTYRSATGGHMFGNYQNYFVQTDFGKYDSKFLNMDYGIGLKIGYFRSNLTDRNYYAFYSENGPFNSYDEKSFLFEPLAFARFGGEKLKLNLKVGYCNVFKIANKDRFIPSFPFNIGFGLNYHIKVKE